MEQHNLWIGCHVSSSKSKLGLSDQFRHIHNMVGAKCFQIFVGNPYGSFSRAQAEKYMEMGPRVKEVLWSLGIKLFIHSPYVLNFAKDPSTEDAYWVNSLVLELETSDAIGAEGCVLHMGKSVKSSVEDAERWFIFNLKTVIRKAKAKNITSKIYVETSAGQGTELYPTLGSLDALVRFYNNFSSEERKHIQLCVDTCHIFAAGYDIGTCEGAELFWREWEMKLGVSNLGVIHMNNSTKACGSRVDRHAALAEGKIGLEGLKSFAQTAAMYEIPMIIETPITIYDVPILAQFILDRSVLPKNKSWHDWMNDLIRTDMFAHILTLENP